jgi:hypothetical protein
MQVLIILIAAVSSCLGFFLIYAPAKAIDIQKKFYAMINWRIEPIDIPKEIRNTRIMGGFLIICVTVLLCYAWFHGIRR